MNLRDHSQPCEHGYKLSHSGGDRWPGMDEFDSAREMTKVCPGGRKVEIDYELAAKACHHPSGGSAPRYVVHAALGIEEDADE